MLDGSRFYAIIISAIFIIGAFSTLVTKAAAQEVIINDTDAENGDWDGWSVEGDTPTWGIVDTSSRLSGTEAFYCAAGYHGGTYEYGNNYDSNLQYII